MPRPDSMSRFRTSLPLQNLSATSQGPGWTQSSIFHCWDHTQKDSAKDSVPAPSNCWNSPIKIKVFPVMEITWQKGSCSAQQCFVLPNPSGGGGNGFKVRLQDWGINPGVRIGSKPYIPLSSRAAPRSCPAEFPAPTGNAFVGIILLLIPTVFLDSILGNWLHLHPGSVREHAQVLEEPLPRASQGRDTLSPGATQGHQPPWKGRSHQDSLDFLQVFVGVLVGHVGGADVELEVWPKVLKVVVVWKF